MANRSTVKSWFQNGDIPDGDDFSTSFDSIPFIEDDAISQAEAEGGVGTSFRLWSALRVRQAIAAWWVTEKTKVQTFAAKITLSVAPRFSSMGANQIMSVDANKDLFSLSINKSIVKNSASLELSGDETSPGNSKYYGTNGAGDKGFYDVPDISDLVENPDPSALTDGAAIAFNMSSKFFELKTLTTNTTSITLTLSNVTQGANQVLSILKNTASDVTITFAGTGLTFYGYNGVDYNSTPQLVLTGASGDIFDISFLARTSTMIGIATGLNGN